MTSINWGHSRVGDWWAFTGIFYASINRGRLGSCFWGVIESFQAFWATLVCGCEEFWHVGFSVI